LDSFKELISSGDIQKRIKEVAAQIDCDYAGKEIVLVMVMKGAICITADLLRTLECPCSLEFIQASSYGNNGTVAGGLTIRGLENLNLQDKHVIIVDDIFDTGNTLMRIKNELAEQHPASLKILVLLLKNKKRTMQDLPDYALFAIEDEFVIGYGLDYKELYRGLPGIYVK
jgi:hypoxanthine phosphoribosyltransferase